MAPPPVTALAQHHIVDMPPGPAAEHADAETPRTWCQMATPAFVSMSTGAGAVLNGLTVPTLIASGANAGANSWMWYAAGGCTSVVAATLATVSLTKGIELFAPDAVRPAEGMPPNAWGASWASTARNAMFGAGSVAAVGGLALQGALAAPGPWWLLGLPAVMFTALVARNTLCPTAVPPCCPCGNGAGDAAGATA